MAERFKFGEKVEGYEVPVINEREARAAAGLLLLPAVFSFLNAYLTHDFLFTKVFVTFFMVDFAVRLFVNPRYAPSLVLGRIIVSNQRPEYVGAAQKKFAWKIGFFLSFVMFFVIVVFEYMTPIKIAVCLLCILLLYSETSFGICLGCIVHNSVFDRDLKLCPGGVCEMRQKEDIQKVSPLQYLSLALAVLALAGFFLLYEPESSSPQPPVMKCSPGKCGSM